MSIKVSVITPCLNSEKTIRDTIESVLGQTYKNIEYILVDGGSTDRTVEIIEEYLPIFGSRLQCTSEKDQGIYDAMNKGLSLASGDMVGIINSDDWYEPDAVEKAVDCFRESNAGVVFGEIWLIDPNGKKQSCTKNSMLPPHPSMFVKREIYQEYGVFDTNYKIAADYELTLRLRAQGVSFAHIDGILANFRTEGVSNLKKADCIEETYQINLKYADRCVNGILNREIAEELYSRSRLLYISKNNPGKIIRVLERKFSDLDRGIVIFGTGNWGRELHTVLRNCNIEIPFFVDNDNKKWGFEWEGSKIFSPEILKDYNGAICIAVKKFQKELCEQVHKYADGNLSVGVYDKLWGAVVRDLELCR